MTDEPTEPTQEPTPAETPPAPEQELQTTPLIDEANRAADRLAKENADLRILLDRRDRAAAEKVLGGETDAGQKQEETAKDYKDKVMKGLI